MLFGESVEQAERVIYSGRFVAEVIAVVVGFQLFTGSVEICAEFFGQSLNVLLEILVEFRVADAAYFGIPFVHRNIHQVVQIAEHADLPKLGDTCKHSKTDIAVARLQCAVECFQRIAEGCLQLRIPNCLKHRLVVFVDKNHYFLSGFFCSSADHSLKSCSKRIFVRIVAVTVFPLFKGQGYFVFKACFRVVFFSVKVHVQNRVYVPVFFQFFHRKAGEQIPLTGEVGIEGGNHKTFSEPSRTAQKVVFPRCGKLVEECRLVNINIACVAEVLEILYTNRI